MGDLVNLAEERHARMTNLKGAAMCLSCRHEWEACAPVGETVFECPKCSMMQGRMVYEVTRQGGSWVCNCGNDLFKIAPEGSYCPCCGAWTEGN